MSDLLGVLFLCAFDGGRKTKGAPTQRAEIERDDCGEHLASCVQTKGWGVRTTSGGAEEQLEERTEQ